MLFIQLTAQPKDDKWPGNSWHVKLSQDRICQLTLHLPFLNLCKSYFSFDPISITMNASYLKRMKKEISSQIDPQKIVDLSINETLYFSLSSK